VSPDEMFYSTELEPGQQESNIRARENTYDQGSSNKLNAATYDQQIRQLDDAVNKGLLSPEIANYQKQQLLKNTPQVAYQQLIPRRGGRGGSVSEQDVLNRAELIKSIKAGIVKNDQTPINMLKLVPGVSYANYVNDGDRAGIEIYQKGSGQPLFIDLNTEDGGEGEINAMLNRISGQQKIPNEHVFQYDTKVALPKSKAKPFLEDIKNSLLGLEADPTKGTEVVTRLSKVAQEEGLYTPEREQIVSISPVEKWWNSAPTRLKITYYKNDKSGNPTTQTATKEIVIDDNHEWIQSLIKDNATTIANSLGAGFDEGTATTPDLDPDI
jgi:hypothetical protein